jgi:uncharacterized protein
MKLGSYVMLAALLCGSPATFADGNARLLVARADGVSIWFEVELALSAASRSRGLMHRAHLAPQAGMWFDFGHDVQVAMWMKDTLIPLDMAFVTANGELVAIHHRAEPLSETVIRAPQAVRYVLETAGGRLADLAVTPGDRMRLIGPSHVDQPMGVPSVRPSNRRPD